MVTSIQCMRWVVVALVGFVVLAIGASADRSVVRGVPSSQQGRYVKHGEWFVCDDGSRRIEWSKVNDNYCDCADGSDEPSTSACPDGQFYCLNVGYRGQYIPSSHVDDGICDCCDGSDEKGGMISSADCPDVCFELGSKWRQEIAERAEREAKGYEIRLGYAAKGQAARVSAEKELAELEAPIRLLKAKVEVLQKEKEKWEAVEAAEKDRLQKKVRLEKRLEKGLPPEELEVPEPEVAVEDQPPNSENEESEDERLLREQQEKEKEERQKLEREVEDDVRSAVAEHNNEEEQGRLSVSEIKRNKRKSKFLKKSDKWSKRTNKKMSPKSKRKGLPTRKEIQEAAILPGEVRALGFRCTGGGALKRFLFNPICNSVQFMIEFFVPPPLVNVKEAKESRTAYENVRKELEEKEARKAELEKKLALDLGADSEFFPLVGECFSITVKDYTYSLCPFSDVKQNERSSTNNLGNWESWEEPYARMKYGGGAKCWNGPARSCVVNIRCGLENKVTRVDEPNKCTYEMDFETPAACNRGGIPDELEHNLFTEEGFNEGMA